MMWRGPRAINQGIYSCHLCGLAVKSTGDGREHCPRCGSHLSFRKPHSLARSWALLLTAAILYIPANLLPVMKTTYFGGQSTDTIMSGVIFFIKDGDFLLAAVIFIASILVPMIKILALGFLLLSVQWGYRFRRVERTRLYQAMEFIGRWSMVDIFVVALLTALVQMGEIFTIEPGIGATAFAMVVIFTILAAMSFDPRIIWDQHWLSTDTTTD
ncbi:MAG: paraquat-inducible protein A [Sedimenticola sp.]